jgi:hypothetical protein
MMGGKKPASSWQISELMLYLKQNAMKPDLNSQTVFLANPAEKFQIDQIIEKYIWPGAIRALAGSSIWIPEGEEGFPSSSLKDEAGNHTTRSLTFVLADEERPFIPGETSLWFCRGNIKCSLQHYIISFDFFLHLPMEFSIGKIIKLLSDPLFCGMPPSLSIELHGEDEHIMVVAFSEGSGADWGFGGFERAGKDLERKLIRNLKVIEAMNRLEQDYKSAKWFRKLQKALREAYQAY